MRKHCGNCANHRKETNQFSEECGKCVSAGLENGEMTDPSHWREKPQTNADRILEMSDEELAEDLYATEQAYKNGYEQGIKDALCAITRCNACANSDTISCSDGMVWCGRMCRYMKEDGFCSFGERKKDEG